MTLEEIAKKLELTGIPFHLIRNLPQRRVALAKQSGSAKVDNGKKRSENRHD